MRSILLCFIAALVAQGKAQSNAPAQLASASIAGPRAVQAQAPLQPPLLPQEQYIEAAIPAPQYVYVRIPFPPLQRDGTSVPPSQPPAPGPEIVYIDEQPSPAPAPVRYGYNQARRISAVPPNTLPVPSALPVPPSPAPAPVPLSPPRTPIYLQYGSVPAPLQSQISNSQASLPPPASNRPFIPAPAPAAGPTPVPAPASATQFIPSPFPRTPEIIYVDAPSSPARNVQYVPPLNPTSDPFAPPSTFRYVPGASPPTPEIVNNQEPCSSLPRNYQYDSTLLSTLRPAPVPTNYPPTPPAYLVSEPSPYQPCYSNNLEYIQQYSAPCRCNAL